MFRMTTLKISLLSALATLFLLVSMLASTGTASAHTVTDRAGAHTTSCQPPYCTPWQPNPQISVYGTYYAGNGCDWMAVVGSGFTPGQAWFYVYAPSEVSTIHTIYSWDFTVNPNSASANVSGGFLAGITVCGKETSGLTGKVINSGVPYSAHLYMIDARGVASNEVSI